MTGVVIYRHGDTSKMKNSWVRYLNSRTMDLNRNNLIVVVGQTGCLPKGSRVMLANGEWKYIENIKEGDVLLSPQDNGSYEYSPVISIKKWKCNENYDIFQLNKKKKLLYSCSYNHEIPISHHNNKNEWITKTISAKEMSKQAISLRGHQDIGLSMFPVEKYQNRKNCKIEPYSLGIFLGDGMFYNVHKKRKSRVLMIYSPDPEVMIEIAKYYQMISMNEDKRGNKAIGYRFSTLRKFAQQLSDYGLEGKDSGTKFIPREALFSDIKYRKRLLAGLIDSDGYLQDGCSYSITTKSNQLADDIVQLIYSLGGRANSYKVKKKSQNGTWGEYNHISFLIQGINLPILTEHRKKKEKKSCYITSNRIAIEIKRNNKIEDVYGITIVSKSNFMITDNYMITKNSGKTFTAMSVAEMISKENGTPFTIDNVVFTLKELMALINSNKLKKGSNIVFDEPQVTISSRDFQSATNKIFNYLLTTFRHRNFTLFFCTPYEDLLDKTARKLFHAKFMMQTIDRNTELASIKPLITEYNSSLGKFYAKYLRVVYKPEGRTRYKQVKLKLWKIPKPSKELIDAYEVKKFEFTSKLNNEIQQQLEVWESEQQFSILKTKSKSGVSGHVLVLPEKLPKKHQSIVDAFKFLKGDVLKTALALGLSVKVVQGAVLTAKLKGHELPQPVVKQGEKSETPKKEMIKDVGEII